MVTMMCHDCENEAVYELKTVDGEIINVCEACDEHYTLCQQCGRAVFPDGAYYLNSEDGYRTCSYCQEKMRDALLQKAYELYKLDWCSKRGYELNNKDEEHGHNGECHVCKAEFEGCAFTDEEYMRSLLDDYDFELWQFWDH